MFLGCPERRPDYDRDYTSRPEVKSRHATQFNKWKPRNRDRLKQAKAAKASIEAYDGVAP